MKRPTLPRRPRLRQACGFTLIELMIVIALIGIIMSIALPSYSSYIARGKRADARAQLLQAAQFMQRFYTANDRYDQDRSTAGVATVMPANLKKAPADSDAPVYELEITATTTTYDLQMRPKRSMLNDECGSFTLSSTGVRGLATAAGGSRTFTIAERDKCWK